MARYDPLPIWKDAVTLAGVLEEAVRRFPRYHKYALGTDLRRQAYVVCRGVVVANGERECCAPLRSAQPTSAKTRPVGAALAANENDNLFGAKAPSYKDPLREWLTPSHCPTNQTKEPAMNRDARVTPALHYLFAGLALALGLQSAPSWGACTAGNPNANVVESTPSADFTDNGNGTVTHAKTGLMWKQCAEGLFGATCVTGAAAATTTMTWSNALAAAEGSSFAGFTDWRLPNFKELYSIVETCGWNPAINQTLFPATPASHFWSASAYVPVPYNSWVVTFNSGGVSSGGGSGNYDARLVRGGQFFDTFDAQDTTPDAFSFTAQTGAALSTVITSNTITVEGINTASPISIVGGTYMINAGAYTSATGTVDNGDTVTLQQTSSGSFSTLTTATLTIGGVDGAFDVTTLAADTTPDPFSFIAQTGVALSALTTSSPITVEGITAASPISIVGGTYSINAGAYTSATGTVDNGDTVTLRRASSASFSTLTTATLTIGGVSGAFNVTTLAAPAAAPAPPSALTARAISSSSIVLGWRDSSNNETGFRIERRLGLCASTNTNPWSEIATVEANVITFTNTGLSARTVYSYRVRAYNVGGNSAYSNCAAVKSLRT